MFKVDANFSKLYYSFLFFILIHFSSLCTQHISCMLLPFLPWVARRICLFLWWWDASLQAQLVWRRLDSKSILGRSGALGVRRSVLIQRGQQGCQLVCCRGRTGWGSWFYPEARRSWRRCHRAPSWGHRTAWIVWQLLELRRMSLGFGGMNGFPFLFVVLIKLINIPKKINQIKRKLLMN